MKMHPIRKLQHRLYGVRNRPEQVEAEVRRSIKPLLDALAREHGIRPGKVDLDPDCSVCRLLAAWKEKL